MFLLSRKSFLLKNKTIQSEHFIEKSLHVFHTYSRMLTSNLCLYFLKRLQHQIKLSHTIIQRNQLMLRENILMPVCVLFLTSFNKKKKKKIEILSHPELETFGFKQQRSERESSSPSPASERSHDSMVFCKHYKKHNGLKKIRMKRL